MRGASKHVRSRRTTRGKAITPPPVSLYSLAAAAARAPDVHGAVDRGREAKHARRREHVAVRQRRRSLVLFPELLWTFQPALVSFSSEHRARGSRARRRSDLRGEGRHRVRGVNDGQRTSSQVGLTLRFGGELRAHLFLHRQHAAGTNRSALGTPARGITPHIPPAAKSCTLASRPAAQRER